MSLTKLFTLAAITLLSFASKATLISDVSTIGADGTTHGSAVFSRGNGQSFTVGISGILSQIDLSLFRTSDTTGNDITFNLYDSDFSTSLFTTSIALSSLPIDAKSGVTSIDISAANLAVAIGDIFAIGLQRQDAAGRPPWVLWSWTSYDGGDFLYGPDLESVENVDVAIRTWINTSVVSEPHASLLIALSLIAIRTTRRRVRTLIVGEATQNSRN